jgi:hypothetical protein
MSAYALPGLFSPLPFEYNNIGISSSCGSSHELCRAKSETLDYKQPEAANALHQRALTTSISTPEVKISVKDAKIDALQLIRSLTNTVVVPSTTTTQQSKQRGRRRRISTAASITTDRPTGSSKTKVNSPQEVAMLFELDVSYQGRQFTMVRSLHRIRQLRDELMDVVHASDYCGDVSDTCCCRSRECCSIPNLPSLQESGSCSVQNFSLLQALLRSYAPALELWLHKVVRLWSTKNGPTLTNFLLEPVCFLHSGTGEESLSFSVDASNGTRCLGRRTSLESIEELHEEYHED